MNPLFSEPLWEPYCWTLEVRRRDQQEQEKLKLAKILLKQLQNR